MLSQDDEDLEDEPSDAELHKNKSEIVAGWLEKDRNSFYKAGYKEGAKHIEGGVVCKCVPVHSFFHACVCAHVSLCMRKYICMQAQKR